jgi:hypothetical protein
MIKKLLKAPELYCAILLLVGVVFVLAAQVKVKNAVLTQGNTQKEVSLPLLESLGDGALFKVSFDIEQKLDVPFEIKVIPDDCAQFVTINNQRIPLHDMPGRCDYSKGFVLSQKFISEHRNGTTTHFEFEIRNGGGPAGLTVFPKESSFLYDVLKYSTMALLALLCMFLARRLGMSRMLCILVLLGVFIRALFFAGIPYTTYSNDVDGHVSYVQYIAENLAIPDKDYCWTCYHPPVYYTIAMPSFKVASWMGIQGTSGLQAFSLLLSVLTLFFGLLFLRKTLRGGSLNIASLLWTLWPVLIMVAPRISNDQMFIFLHVFCMWAGINYLKSGRGKYLVLAAIATPLAYWTKTTAVVTLGMFFLFAVGGYFLNARYLKATKSEVVAWVVFVLTLAGIVVQKLVADSALVGNAHALNHKLMVPNEFVNYVYLDLKSYLTYPFTSAWDDSMGREYFWNYTLKSSLFGEFRLGESTPIKVLASLVGTTLLGLIAYAVRGFWKTKSSAEYWVVFLNGFAFIAALMAFRIMVPYSCSNDFRFIVPVLLSFVYFVALGVNVEGGSAKWKVVGNALVVVFALCSAVLYILAI